MANIAQTANSRVFLTDGGARPDHTPVYQSCLRMMALSQGFGDIERIECPDPSNYGKFIEVASIRGASERPTTSIEGRLSQELLSTLLALARKGCSFDVQLHFGSCQNPSVFDDYDKALILEGAYPTNYSTEDLGALASGDNAVVNESADISAEVAYEVVPLAVASRAGTIITNEVVDTVLCDNISCGECEGESDGCNKVVTITKAAGGSPGTPPDIVYTIDGGSNWFAHDIDTLTDAQDPNAVECMGGYVVVVSNSANSLSYALKSELDGVTDPAWTEITTGFVTGGEPTDIWSDGTYAFIVGDAGYIYGTSDPTAGVTVLDAGVANNDGWLAVHGLSSNFAVAVGNHGAIAVTHDGSTWASLDATSPVGIGTNFNTVWVVNETTWFVGASNGYYYYTLNAGLTWTGHLISGSASVLDIVFSTKSVGYLALQTSTTKGRIYRTINGGQSWKQVPEKSGSMPANDKINALAYCTADPNFVVGVGLADDGSDGFIIVGAAGSV